MAEVNGQRSTASAAKAGVRSAIERVERQIKRLWSTRYSKAPTRRPSIPSSKDPGSRERERLANALTETSEDKPLLHPNLAANYRAQVETL